MLAKPRPQVQTTWAQTRPANSETGDPGSVTIVHFIVDNVTLSLTDELGSHGPRGGKTGPKMGCIGSPSRAMLLT
jgi:hypothetical protein